MVDSNTFKRQMQLGFTMVELIVTMMIIGILAITALPRLIDSSDFDDRRFSDEVMAALQYAQKAAIATRRNVCVTFTISSVTLTIASAPGNAQACTLDLAGPTGVTPFAVNAPDGTSFAARPADFIFNALGSSSVATQAIQVAGASTSITVEQESGYVHP